MMVYRNPGSKFAYLAPETLEDKFKLVRLQQEGKLDTGMHMGIKDKYKAKYAKKFGIVEGVKDGR